MKEVLPPEEQEFMRVTKGIHARFVAKAMNNVTPGIEWDGCTKNHMARSYGHEKRSNSPMRVSVKYLDLYLLRAQALSRSFGFSDWNKETVATWKAKNFDKFNYESRP